MKTDWSKESLSPVGGGEGTEKEIQVDPESILKGMSRPKISLRRTSA
jgi:hypothetical protein